MDVNHSSGWTMYLLYLVEDIKTDEFNLDAGRFSNFQKEECPHKVLYQLRDTSGEEISNLITKSINLIAEQQFVWDMEIITHSVNYIEIFFKFKYDEDAIIFKLMN